VLDQDTCVCVPQSVEPSALGEPGRLDRGTPDGVGEVVRVDGVGEAEAVLLGRVRRQVSGEGIDDALRYGHRAVRSFVLDGHTTTPG
jgi:hypothetical protein